MSTLTTSYQLLDSKYLGTSGGNLYVRIYAKYSEQDITNNQTKVQYQARAYYENSTYIYDQSGNGSVSGTSASTVSGSCTRPTTGETVIATTEAWVPHNSDGTMSISASATLNFPNWGWSATASGSATLPTIPRATACPNLDGYIESSAPISLNPASSSFKHRLYYSYNGKEGYYPSSTEFFANTGSLSLDTSFYSYTPKSSGTGSITLYTYDSSSNLIGSKDGTLTVRCDKEKCKPIITADIIDSNEVTVSLTGDNSKLIKGYSNAQITYTIDTLNNASLKSKTVNSSVLGDSPHTIYGVSTGTFNIVAVDSREFDTPLTKNNTLVEYIPLTLDFNAYRPTPTGSTININFQGNYFNSAFGSVTNELSLSWKYRVKGSSDWIDGSTFVKDTDYTISDNRFYSIGDITLSDTLFDYQTNYEIVVYYADKLINIYTIKTVPKGEPILSWEDLLVNVNGNLNVLKGNTNELYSNGNNIRVLPTGEDTREYWNNLPNGIYWHGNTGAVPNLPTTYAWVWKFGTTSNGDFSILFFEQAGGAQTRIFRKSGNAYDVSGWYNIFEDDTGWVDMSAYINTEYFSARDGMPPMARRIGIKVYWKGFVYCTTAIDGKFADILINLPDWCRSEYEHGSGSIQFDDGNDYMMYVEGNAIKIYSVNNIAQTDQYKGFAMSNISGYLTD